MNKKMANWIISGFIAGVIVGGLIVRSMEAIAIGMIVGSISGFILGACEAKMIRKKAN